ncbi:DUF4170 domain-containing protein [Fodinicurvata halophila]|uniref:DUF4170 domain-containing protein n=1 Tax=Fodinicurvata halophila TaxID=1419723 RepID=A0ABV8UHZ3_9PROT
MQQYWVVGGEYRDANFTVPLEGREEWIGPFGSYHQAKAEWARLAWSTVDDAQTRYRIESMDQDQAPPCTD